MSGDYLDSGDRAALARHLNETLADLEAEITALEERTRPVAPDRAIGRLSRLEAINERSVGEASLRSARLRAQRIRGALAHMEDDAFGLCAECAEAIPLARLRSVPGTRLCVRCAEQRAG
jgi:DnaK suppressor protein